MTKCIISAQIEQFEMFSIPYLNDEMYIILSVGWIFHYSDNVQNSHALLHFPESKAIRINLNPSNKVFFVFVFFFCFFVGLFCFLHLKHLGYSLTIYTRKFDC